MSYIARLTCEQAFRRLDDYVDREIAADEMRLVKEHLEICAVCAAEYQFEASVIEHVRLRLQNLAAPNDLRQKVSRLLDSAISAG
jgi:anti-sigma factor (TIGR02949 family)